VEGLEKPKKEDFYQKGSTNITSRIDLGMNENTYKKDIESSRRVDINELNELLGN
jgi:hypothetical protein